MTQKVWQENQNRMPLEFVVSKSSLKRLLMQRFAATRCQHVVEWIVTDAVSTHIIYKHSTVSDTEISTVLQQQDTTVLQQTADHLCG